MKSWIRAHSVAGGMSMVAPSRSRMESARRGGLRVFAERYPLGFALVFSAVSTCLAVLDTFVLPLGLVNGALQTVLALGVLIWFGWTCAAGFNGPSRWRSLHLLWLPALLALFSFWTFVLVRPSSVSIVLAAIVLTFLTGLNEEARFRGVILQALLPYGWFRAALLSALLFGAAHLVNLVAASPLVVLAQVVGAFLMGLGYAACRLRTNTIWPLVVVHACGDLTTVIATLSGRGITLAPTIGVWVYVSEILALLLLAGYGLFLLRPKQRPTASASVMSKETAR